MRCSAEARRREPHQGNRRLDHGEIAALLQSIRMKRSCTRSSDVGDVGMRGGEALVISRLRFSPPPVRNTSASASLRATIGRSLRPPLQKCLRRARCRRSAGPQRIGRRAAASPRAAM